MKKYKFLKLTALLAAFVLILTACSNSGDETETNPSVNDTSETVKNEDVTGNTGSGETTVTEEDSEEAQTVEITDVHGRVVVPVNPKNVVSLDNRTFETLADWGIELAAAPKAVMAEDSPYVSDDSVQDIGNHREPNLEVIAAVEPELVIIGQRFAAFYDDIKEIVPNAVVIDLNFDVSGQESSSGDSLINGLKDSTISLGQIFDKNDEAEQLITDFDNAVKAAKDAYNGRDTIMSVIVSGGNIGFAAPLSGRVWGPMYEVFEWVPALEIDEASSDHQGDDVSVEAIAQSNPDRLFVLDRDAGVSSTEDNVPAKDIIENSPALQNTTAISKNQIVYAPADTYTNESIQTYLELFEEITNALTQ